MTIISNIKQEGLGKLDVSIFLRLLNSIQISDEISNALLLTLKEDLLKEFFNTLQPRYNTGDFTPT